MKIKHEVRGVRTSKIRRQPGKFAVLLALVGALSSIAPEAKADGPACIEAHDPALAYPQLPDPQGPDLVGEAGVVFTVEADRTLVEIGGCLYELGERGLELDFAGLDQVDLIFELPENPTGAPVLVEVDGVAIETFETLGGTFEYAMTDASSLAFDFGQVTGSASGPILIRKPIEDDPDPA